MKTNSNLKPSGVEWIGDIPKHWEVKKLSTLYEERKCKNIGNSEKNVLSLSYGNIVKRNMENNMGLLPESFESYNVILPDNIVLRLTDLQNDHKSLRCGLVKEKGIITSAYVTLEKKNENISSNYFYRLLYTFDIMKGFYGMGDGVRQGLKFDDGLSNLNVAVPPFSEQKQIADYLDEKCADIDSVCETEKTVIERLKEYKRSLIARAVTKGISNLNNSNLKPSGVEWIGDIPKHWEVVKTSRIFHNEKEIVGDKANLTERLALTLNGVIKRDKNDSEGLQPQQFNTYQFLRKNQLVFKLIDLENISTSRVGLCPFEVGMVSPAYIVLKNDSKDNRYYYYYFLSLWQNEVFNHLGGEGVRSALNVQDLLNISTLNLTFSEQKQIADYLDEKCGQIDEAIKQKEKVIETLGEYKKSLIYETVTGKRDFKFEK